MSNEPSRDTLRTVDHVAAEPLGQTIDTPESLQITDSHQSAAPSDAPVIPGYVITALIARGGMGRVYAGHDLTLDREVAIKTLLPDANAERFVTESKITAKLPHPHIPPVYALGTLGDGAPFLVMKRIHGRTLAELLKARTNSAQELPRFMQIFEQIAQAVGFAHSRGIIHRDLKPLNVMVGEFGEVQVMDWGLAKDLSSRDEVMASPLAASDDTQLTSAGAVMGTPSYMAPEQARGEVVDVRADVFALGSVLAAILTGKPAFEGTTLHETVDKAARAELGEVLSRLDACGVDAELVTLAKRCLSSEASDRPADGRAVAAEVSAYRAGVEARLHQAETERAAALVREGEQRKRRRQFLIAAGLVAAVLLAGLAVSLWQMNRALDAEATATQATAEAKTREKAEAEAKELARRQTQRAEANLRKTELAVYMGKLSLAQSAFVEGNGVMSLHYLSECQWNLRGWEHRHLWTRISSKQILKGHTHVVCGVAFSPDGKRIVTGSEDMTAKVWDAEKGQEILSLKGHTSPVVSVAFSPDGERAFAWDKEGKVLAWSTVDGKPTPANDPPPRPAPGLARSPDGHFVAKPEGADILVTDLREPPPSNVWPFPDADERKRYHSEQAALADKEGKWFAVAFHLGRLLLDDPDNATLKQRRTAALRKHATANTRP